MAPNDYYKILGVSRDAKPEEIRKAYKKLSRKYHPDVNKERGASENFQKVQEAFDVLGDEQKRAQYDRFGTVFPGGAAGPQAGWRTTTGPVDLGDIFGGQFDIEDLFGGAMGGAGMGGSRGRAGRRPKPGQDVEVEIEIPFNTAVNGGTHELALAKNGGTSRLSVKIPAGVDTGSVVRLAGQGHPGANGGPPGDLLVRLRVARHPWFRREGNDLLVDVPVSFAEAALGAKVEVPTLTEGMIVVTVPPGTSSGAKLRLRGKGAVDRATGQRGDQYVIIKVVVPGHLTERAKELVRQLDAAAPVAPRKGLW